MPSKALEANIAESRVEIIVDPKYDVLKKVMGKYYGIRDGLQTFLAELCHPYKNWEFIVSEARSYSLNYFHVLKTHPLGTEAAGLYLDIFFQAIDSSVNEDIRVNATDNLLLFIQRIIKDAGDDLPRFFPVLDEAFDQIMAAQKKAGYKVTVMSDEDIRKWENADQLGKMQEIWIKEAEAAGLKNAREVMEKMRVLHKQAMDREK